MSIDIKFTFHALDLSWDNLTMGEGRAGARAEFVGLVRATEDNKTITGLEYEVYRPMADNVLRRILEQLGQQYPCFHVQVSHRMGVVPVGEAAIRVVVLAVHRREAFSLMTALMDRLKQDVPIWKVRAIVD